MPFATMKEVLGRADENGFAVAAVNIFNAESAAWVVKAAELERLPVILMLYPDVNAMIPIPVIGAACRAFAQLAGVPVGVHLDHSRTAQLALSGIPAGFQSIMIDGSALPFEENVTVTKLVVDCAHIFGAQVEAELGYVGRDSDAEELFNTELYTKPGDAAAFVERTGIDALAVAIGNSHGRYITDPHLDIPRLDEINRAVSVPLVIHGGSGIPGEQMAEAVRHGINKVNIGTEFFAKCKEAVGRHVPAEGIIMRNMAKAGEEVIELVRDRMRMLNPSGYKLP